MTIVAERLVGEEAQNQCAQLHSRPSGASPDLTTRSVDQQPAEDVLTDLQSMHLAESAPEEEAGEVQRIHMGGSAAPAGPRRSSSGGASRLLPGASYHQRCYPQQQQQALTAEQPYAQAYMGYPAAVAYSGFQTAGFQPVVVYSYPPGAVAPPISRVGPQGLVHQQQPGMAPAYNASTTYMPGYYVMRPVVGPAAMGAVPASPVGSAGWGGAPLAPAPSLPSSLSSPRASAASQQSHLPSNPWRTCSADIGTDSLDSLPAPVGRRDSDSSSTSVPTSGLRTSAGLSSGSSSNGGQQVAPHSLSGVDLPGADGSGASSTGGAGPRANGNGRAQGGRQACAFFLKTGTCAWGDRCKFEHPYDKAPRVEFNSLGLPLRPGEPPCAYYLKNLSCAFGHTCKFHHPELPTNPATAATAAAVAAVAAAAVPRPGHAGAVPMGTVFPSTVIAAGPEVYFPAALPAALPGIPRPIALLRSGSSGSWHSHLSQQGSLTTGPQQQAEATAAQPVTPSAAAVATAGGAGPAQPVEQANTADGHLAVAASAPAPAVQAAHTESAPLVPLMVFGSIDPPGSSQPAKEQAGEASSPGSQEDGADKAASTQQGSASHGRDDSASPLDRFVVAEADGGGAAAAAEGPRAEE